MKDDKIKPEKLISLLESLHCLVVCCRGGTIAECQEGGERGRGRENETEGKRG